MSNLSFEQKSACRANPLAAMLAKRIGWMMAWVTVINLCSLGLAMMAGVYASGGASQEIVHTLHLWAFGLLGLNLVSGLILAGELWWMRKYQISPESFSAVCDVPGFQVKGINHDWRHLVAGARRFASHCGNQQRDAKSVMEREYLRSLEVQAKAIADIMEAMHMSMEEKQTMGWHGSRMGFRQKEMTTSTLQRVVRIAQQAIRSSHGKRQKRVVAKT